MIAPRLRRLWRRTEVFLEKRKRAAPGKVGSRLVVAGTRRVVVETIPTLPVDSGWTFSKDTVATPMVGSLRSILENVASCCSASAGVSPTGDKRSGASARNPSTAKRRVTSSICPLRSLAREVQLIFRLATQLRYAVNFRGDTVPRRRLPNVCSLARDFLRDCA